jgi:hypothetical protein
MDTRATTRRTIAALAACAFGIAAPLTTVSLAHAAVHGHGISHSRDSDGDKMPNRWETRHHLDAHKANAQKDADRDGLVNLSEFRDGTDPQDADTDDDGVEDGQDDAADCSTDQSDDQGDDQGDDSAGSQDDGADDCSDSTEADDADDDADDSASRVRQG